MQILAAIIESTIRFRLLKTMMDGPSIGSKVGCLLPLLMNHSVTVRAYSSPPASPAFLVWCRLHGPTVFVGSMNRSGRFLGLTNDSYWRGYLMARHHVDLVIGVVLMAVVLISILTGRTYVKYHGIVSRADDPKTFWWSVVFYCLLGLVFLGLCLYTAN